MKKIKIGIFGLGRGLDLVQPILANDGEIVAVCEKMQERITTLREKIGNNFTEYQDFDKFINHDMDAVLICNGFNEHTKYAIKCLEKNIHVLCETTSNATMAEGVQLVRSAKKSKAFYMIAENYPFMKFNQEINKVVKGGSLGKVLYAEGEYNHAVFIEDTNAYKKYRFYRQHWRNFLPRTYYLTHSLAPLMYFTGATPKRVTAMPCFCPPIDNDILALDNADRASIITILNDDNSVFRITGHASFGANENSYRVCGTKGQIENVRGTSKILLRYNWWQKPEGMQDNNEYQSNFVSDSELAEKMGHDGGDFFVIKEFFTSIRDNKKPIFDEYFATTMASVGILAHRSQLEKGVPYDIPDFHNEQDCIKYENDNLTPFYGENGEKPTLPCCSNPNYKSTQEELYNDILNK